MPNLDAPFHVEMLRGFKHKNTLFRRLAHAAKRELFAKRIYGLEWGDPEEEEGPLRFVRDRYLLPFVVPGQTAVEIGPGGGRWTRYMLPFRTLYAVDYHQVLLDELRRNFDRPNIILVKNNGTDFPDIPTGCADFIFSFGCFVHLDLDIIDEYLVNIRKIVKPTANIVLQYADKNKIIARENAGFSENDPDRMRELVLGRGYKILGEDLTTLCHSAIIRIRVA